MAEKFQEVFLYQINFTSNLAPQGSGGAVTALSHRTSSVVIMNSQIQNNSAKDGGFLYSNSSVLDLIDNQFTINNAINGGAVYSIVTDFTINNCNFNKNTGGAI